MTAVWFLSKWRWWTPLIVVGVVWYLIDDYGDDRAENALLEQHAEDVRALSDSLTAVADSIHGALVADTAVSRPRIRELEERQVADSVRLAAATAMVRNAENIIVRADINLDAALDTLRTLAPIQLRPLVARIETLIVEDQQARDNLIRIQEVRAVNAIAMAAHADSVASEMLVELNGTWAAYDARVMSEEEAREALAAELERRTGVEQGSWYDTPVRAGAFILTFGLGACVADDKSDACILNWGRLVK